MRFGTVGRLLFVLYCVEAGVVFFLVPWGAAWDRTVVQFPFESLRSALLHPFFRSLVTAFGVVHLVWAVNDVDWLIRHWRARRKRTT